ncbi:hypothetical protein Taro_009472 [Colocasia esculenta]|uniref:Uncharacterized protein n=1 Tax=Colocasia esculenta TaxID=4460 RepID=A0A843U0X7_COLES|nr:hypothetical protein [Colocasia esculenta]
MVLAGRSRTISTSVGRGSASSSMTLGRDIWTASPSILVVPATGTASPSTPVVPVTGTASPSTPVVLATGTANPSTPVVPATVEVRVHETRGSPSSSSRLGVYCPDKFKKVDHHELERAPTFRELFDRTHKRKGTDDYVSESARTITETYDRTMVDRYVEGTPQQDLDPKAWVDAAGGPRRVECTALGTA